MSFVSFEFLVLLGLVLALYTRLAHSHQNKLLLCASYVFYGWWDWRFLALIAFSSAVDYACGRAIAKHRDEPSRAKMALWVSVGVNLGALAFFKYCNFFVDSARELLFSIGLSGASSWETLDIILPVGISFYTFQTMSYTIDIYRGKLEPTDKLVDFFLYVSFFPQLVAGPIERATRLLPQIQKAREVSAEKFVSGFQLALLGLFKKMVVADNLGLFVNAVFDNPKADISQTTVILATYAFAFQIYGDFSGYTDIARGVARMLGFDLRTNFKQPYTATNPSDFWQRWHISLSTWLRDYLYIPLGGNRLGNFKTYRNLFITMLLGGLWHGAAWNFVLWGAYHGLLLAVFHQFLPRKKAREATSSIRGGPVFWLKVLAFFQLTCVGWLLFRVDSMAQLTDFVGALFEWPTAPIESLMPSLLLVVSFATPMLALDYLCYRKQDGEPWRTWPAWAQTALIVVFFYGIVLFGSPYDIPFLYFQF